MTLKLKTVIVLIVTLFALRGASVQAAIFDVDEAIVKARALSNEGKYEEALDELVLPLIDADNGERARIFVARCWIKLASGNVFDALADVDYAVSVDSDNPCAHLERAQLYVDLGEPELSAIDADKALAAGCDAPELMTLRGRLYIHSGDISRAVDFMNKALSSSESRFDALGFSAFAYSMLGYPEVAVQFYVEALKDDPDNPRLHSELADAYVMVGDFKRAFRHYERSLELDAGNGITANNYGYTLFFDGRVERAREIFSELNKANPNPYSLCNVVEINIHERKWKAAMKFGRLCLAAFGNDPYMAESERYYVQSIALVLAKMQRDRLAMHPLTQIDLARQHAEHGEYVPALATYLIALMLEPQNIEALYEAGRLFVLLGDSLKGYSFLNMAASLAGPGDPVTLSAKEIIDRETFSQSYNDWYYPVADPFEEAK